MQIKKIIGILIRIILIVFFSFVALLNLLTVFTSPLAKRTINIPQPVSVTYNILNFIASVGFMYGVYLLIRNKPGYFKYFSFLIPAFYLLMTVYRFFFITTYQLQGADFSNFLIFFIPLGLLALGYYLEPKTQPVPVGVTPDLGPFTPLQFQGFFIRGIANIIDQVLILVPFILLAAVTHTSLNESGPLIYLAVLVFLIYLIVSEAVWGTTIGKRVFGMQVKMQDGRPCTLSSAIIRNVFRIVDAFIGAYIIALIVMSITPKRQRIGDLIAKTVVIKP